MNYHIDTPKNREMDRRGILDPDSWPRWPLLPVKRTGPELQCGLLLAAERPFKVYKTNLHLLKSGWLRPQLDEAGTYGSYSTIEEMQNDGWRVD